MKKQAKILTTALLMIGILTGCAVSETDQSYEILASTSTDSHHDDVVVREHLPLNTEGGVPQELLTKGDTKDSEEEKTMADTSEDTTENEPVPVVAEIVSVERDYMYEEPAQETHSYQPALEWYSEEPEFSEETEAEAEETETEVLAPHTQETVSTESTEADYMPLQTEEIGCIHDWHGETHSEVGHYESYNACSCGFRFENITSYDIHVSEYEGTPEMFTTHGHWGTVDLWVVDSAAYMVWQCRICGETSLASP